LNFDEHQGDNHDEPFSSTDARHEARDRRHRFSNGGLIVSASASAIVHRQLIIALAARYKLPAVYPARDYVVSGGLISYAADFVDQFRRAAGYVDRILKGEKPADLPVQAAAKYELIINLKTAKALGLTMPQSVLARADEVIE
jgi:putative ABC transport system substrate-binding protein